MSGADLRLDAANECLWQGDRRIDLTPKNFQVLTYLIDRPAKLVTKRELLDAIWPETHVTEGVLSVAITQLRDQLGDDARTPSFIETIHRRGYRWIGPETRFEKSTPTISPPSVAPLRDSLLVGRDAELASLWTALERARRGQRQLVFVSGEAGIGKTSLVDQFITAVRASAAPMRPPAGREAETPVPHLVARGQCLEHFGVGEAYLPFLEAISRLSRESSAGDLGTILRQHAPTWFVQVPWLLTDSDRDSLQHEIAGGTRERMLREFAAAIEVLTRDRVLILVLEDLHWSDPSTLMLLSMIAQRREPARFLLLGTFRPVDAVLAAHQINDLKRQLVGRAVASEISLSLLEPTHIADYLERRFSPDVAQALTTNLHRRTDGNPLFVINVLDHLLDRDLLASGQAGWKIAEEGTELRVIPENLRQTIEQQVDRLAADEVTLLETVSTAGGEITAAALAAVAEMDATAVDSHCDRLVRRSAFLRSTSTGGYELSHALYQGVLYDRQAPARRMQRHRRIADWLIANDASPAGIVHHLTRAGAASDRSRLVEFAAQAAVRARAVFAFDEACAHYQTALAHLATDGSDARRRSLLMIGLAEAEERAGQIARANQTFLRAAAIGREVGDADLMARAALGLGRAYQLVGQSNHELIELLEESLARLANEERSLRAKILARLTWALCAVAGSDARREQLSAEATRIARELDDPDTWTWVMQYTRWSFPRAQTVDQLRAGAAEIAALYSRVIDKEQLMMLHLLRACDLLEIGDVDDADIDLQALSELVDETQIPWFRWFLKRVQTVRALLEGHTEDAERLAGAAVEAAQGMDHPNVMPLFTAQMVMLRWQQGRAAEIEPMVRAYVDQNPTVAAWRAVHACLLSELDLREEVHDQLERLAAADFADIPHDSVWLNTIAFLSIVCAYLGDAKRATVLNEMLSPYADRCVGITSATFALGHASRYLALLAATRGEREAAEQLFERGIAENERLRAWPWADATRRDQRRFARDPNSVERSVTT